MVDCSDTFFFFFLYPCITSFEHYVLFHENYLLLICQSSCRIFDYLMVGLVLWNLEKHLFLIWDLLIQENGNLQRMASYQNPSMGWPGVPGIPTAPVVKRVVRLDVPVDKYPNVSGLIFHYFDPTFNMSSFSVKNY